jgi:purine-binding chemotaxis protein CheW
MSMVVGMRVGEGQFALPVDHVREIARLGAISPVPGAGAALLGVRNLRGQVLPIFDLAALLGVGGGERPARIVVAEHRGQRAGLAIDAVTDVGELPDAGPAGRDALVSASGLIDVPRLFGALEERVRP